VFLNGNFSATGGVRLPGARIRGQLACSGATFTNPHGDALTVDGAEISGGLVLQGLSATGTVRLVGTKIGHELDCSGAVFANKGGYALSARDADVGAAIILRDTQFAGGIDLFRASATTLDDDLGALDAGSWANVEPLVLDSFAYARFGQGAIWDSKSRSEWLQQTTGFQRGAWQQLIEIYRAQGQVDEANRVAIAMQNDRVKRTEMPWHRAAGRRILWATVGHGYRPSLAGIWALGVIAAFAVVVLHWSGMLVPANPATKGSPQPVAYATDTFLPIVDFGEASDWTPTGWLRWINWSVVLLGWALTTIFVAGFTRIVRTE
jgi:hypothetical protein